MQLSIEKTRTFVDGFWEKQILPTLSEYIKIPNCTVGSRDFDDPAETDRAAKLLFDWAHAQLSVDPTVQMFIEQTAGKTPLIFINIPGTKPGNILLYGHLDKQPPDEGLWSPGLGPYTPVIQGDFLYGRGAVDDGYSMPAAVGAILALWNQGVAHPRCTIIIESSEESGSPDLKHYFSLLADKIGTPDLVICLDSHCTNYESLGITDTLRGIVNGVLRVDVLTTQIHSGYSGIVPAAFHVLRERLDRVHDSHTQRIKLSALWVDIPKASVVQAHRLGKMLGSNIWEELPLAKGIRPLSLDPTELVINQTWSPTMTITGLDGLPATTGAPNAEVPFLGLGLSFRLPPGVNPEVAGAKLKEVFEWGEPGDPLVTFTVIQAAEGWHSRALSPKLRQSIDSASVNYLGNPAIVAGIGGTIPLMVTLSNEFPNSEHWVTGGIGPNAGAHAPNERLNIPMTKGLIASIAQVISEFEPPPAS